MARHTVCKTEDLPPGSRKIVEVEGRSIGVFNVHGDYFALRNLCPHRGGELCRGPVTGMMLPSSPQTLCYDREGEILRCPWHGWEFDLKTGDMIIQPGMRVKMYDVSVERFDVTVEEETVVLHV